MVPCQMLLFIDFQRIWKDFRTNKRLNWNAVPTIFNWSGEKLKQTSYVEIVPEESIPRTMAVQIADSVDIKTESLSCDISDVSCTTSKSNSSISETQTHQTLSKNTMEKAKLQDLLSIQKNKFNDLLKKFFALQKYCSDREEKSSSLEFFHLLCDNFLNKGFANFVKVQSKLTLLDPRGHGFSYQTKQFALMVYFLGPTVFRFLQKSWSLPSVRTLQKTTDSWEINPGLNDFLFKVLAVKANSMTMKSKECILCVNEMSLKSFLFFDFKRDEIIGFHNIGSIKSCDIAKSVIVLMIRGLHSSWKQPIGYFFIASACTGYDLQNIIFQTVQKLANISINVLVMISDLSSSCKRFANSLSITPHTPYFNIGDKEIVYIFDPPYLLKATRNHFFEYRFKSQNKIAEKVHLTNFYDSDSSKQHRLAPILTKYHLNPNSFQKMSLKLASEIFNHTVVAGMTTLVSYDKLPHSASDTIDFLDSMNKLFYIFNSHPISTEVSNPKELRPYSLPFSNSYHQKYFLNLMFDYFLNLEIQKFDAKIKNWVNVAKH
ncbi:hypothetical protein QTP88_017219 [Uroleucon formosanum]